MPTFDPVPALVAGLAGTIAMTLMMQASAAAGMTRMPSMTLIQGTMVTGDRRTATRIGAITHLLMMGTVVFGLLYAALFVAVGDAGALVGAGIGLVHGLIAGMAMAMMGSMHPRMDPLPIGSDEVIVESAGEIRIVEPGLFARNYGPMTPVGLILGHVVFGLVVGAVYGPLAG